MRVPQNVAKDMLKNIPDPRLREVYGSILQGKIVAQVHCLSEDIKNDIEVPAFDDNGDAIFYKSGAKKGEPKMVKQTILSREGCKGRVIAYIDDQGRVDETEPVLNDNENFTGQYKSGLEGSRMRIDGQMGFRCYCGNSSVLCEEEKGVISPARPSAADIEKVLTRLSKRTDNLYAPKNGKTEIDGFVIEELKV